MSSHLKVSLFAAMSAFWSYSAFALCDVELPKVFYERFTDADNIFTGVVKEIKPYTGASSDLAVKPNKVASVEVVSNWKGRVNGTVQVVYRDINPEACDIRNFHIESGSKKIVFYVKKSGDKLETSQAMGSGEEAVSAKSGTLDALRFLGRSGVTKKDFDEFRKKQQQKAGN